MCLCSSTSLNWYCNFYVAFMIFEECRLISTKLMEKMEKYNITAKNLYNWDKKGFLLGLAHVVKRIMKRHALRRPDNGCILRWKPRVS
jgi:hypothetical protein